jgi:short-subunit dehydrogenase
MSHQPLRGRAAVITGASSGIGKAAAEALAREGVRVTLGARRADRLEAVADAIRRSGGDAQAVPTDVADPVAVQRLIAEAQRAYGRLDIALLNAGIGYFGPVDSTPVDEAHRLLDINLFGTLHGIQAAVPVMREQGSGHIIIVSSVSGKRATPGSGLYAATKSAQISLAESLRLEVRRAGIQVSVICPVSTTTEFFAVAGARSPMQFRPTGPTYSAGQVAEVIVRCVRRPRPEVMVYPPTRLMAVLNAAAPALMDRILARVWAKIRPNM